MMTRPHLLDALRDRVLLCDGGMGSHVQGQTLDIESDYWGRENCTDVLVLSRPDMIREIHKSYFAAGADMAETNTFGGSPIAPSRSTKPPANSPARPPNHSPTAATAGSSAASAPAPSYPASAPSPTTRWRLRLPNNAAA
jgi:hypothetical protein